MTGSRCVWTTERLLLMFALFASIYCDPSLHTTGKINTGHCLCVSPCDIILFFRLPIDEDADYDVKEDKKLKNSTGPTSKKERRKEKWKSIWKKSKNKFSDLVDELEYDEKKLKQVKEQKKLKREKEKRASEHLGKKVRSERDLLDVRGRRVVELRRSQSSLALPTLHRDLVCRHCKRGIKRKSIQEEVEIAQSLPVVRLVLELRKDRENLQNLTTRFEYLVASVSHVGDLLIELFAPQLYDEETAPQCTETDQQQRKKPSTLGSIFSRAVNQRVCPILFNVLPPFCLMLPRNVCKHNI